MTFKVGDLVSFMGDLARVVSVRPEDRWPYIIRFTDGGNMVAREDELEAAE